MNPKYRIMVREWTMGSKRWSSFFVQEQSWFGKWKDCGSVYADAGGGRDVIGCCPDDYKPYFHVRYFDKKKDAQKWIDYQSIETEVTDYLPV